MQTLSATLAAEPQQLTARALIRLIQCPVCSKPLSVPITLPCGHSICRACLPLPHRRENISYPNEPERVYGIVCPYTDCGLEHAVGDYKPDVILAHIISTMRADVQQKYQEQESAQLAGGVKSGVMDQEMALKLASRPDHRDSIQTEKITQDTGIEGLIAMFCMSEGGALAYEPDALAVDNAYSSMNPDVINFLRDIMLRELECQICYNLLLDPVTTVCGHTLCRHCLLRVFDHSRCCPVCRHGLQVAHSPVSQPSNQRLAALLTTLCLDAVSKRYDLAAQEGQPLNDFTLVPLFICFSGFPQMPSFLHVFEPRYRLMIRRAMLGNKRFGLLMSNPNRDQPGQPSHREYGTMMEIDHCNILPDGRSILELRGVERFKVLSSSLRDGYTVANIELVMDINVAEEEAIERREIMSVGIQAGTGPDPEGYINRLPTQQLVLRTLDFLHRSESSNPAWLSRDFIACYGRPPNDPAILPYWFASVYPLDANETYALLYTTSVRGRLKIVNRWIHRIRSQRWYRSGGCVVS